MSTQKNFDHPCFFILINDNENKCFSFETETLFQKLYFDNINPLTKEPFTYLEKEKIILYHNCLNKLPKLKKDTKIDKKLLFQTWLDINFKKEKKSDSINQELINLQARLFLNPEDLFGIFFNPNFKKSSLLIREEAEKYLKFSGKQWLLRYSSLVDDDNSKSYALTIIIGGVSRSFAIIYKVNEGYFFNVDLSRGENTNKNFTYSHSFICIIDLINSLLYEQLKIYVNY